MSENQNDTLNLVVTDERMGDIDLETFYFLETSPKAMIDFVAHFAADDDENYLDHDDAVKAVLKGRKLRDIEDLVMQLRGVMDESALPKGTDET